MVRSRGGADPEAVETLREWKPQGGGDPEVGVQTFSWWRLCEPCRKHKNQEAFEESKDMTELSFQQDPHGCSAQDQPEWVHDGKTEMGKGTAGDSRQDVMLAPTRDSGDLFLDASGR